MSGFAWVTLATNDSYSLGALVLAHSLRRVGTRHDLAVLITPGVTDSMREKLASVFTLVKEVNVLDSKDEANLAVLQRPELGVTFTKLHCWRLTQYEKCVFIDADALVVRNCDELFEREELSAAPDVGWPDCFNSGVFVYRPSQQTFASITSFAASQGSFDGADQGLLNMYFSDWAHKDISKHLPFIYNMCSTATYSYAPAFKQYGENVRIVHFIGATKPWLQYFDTLTGIVQPPPSCGHLQPLLQIWWNIFCDSVHPQLSDAMGGLAGALSKLTMGESRTAEQQAIEDHMRKQNWEQGHIDFMGRDSFDNILKKINETLATAPAREPSPIKVKHETRQPEKSSGKSSEVETALEEREAALPVLATEDQAESGTIQGPSEDICQRISRLEDTPLSINNEQQQISFSSLDVVREIDSTSHEQIPLIFSDSVELKEKSVPETQTGSYPKKDKQLQETAVTSETLAQAILDIKQSETIVSEPTTQTQVPEESNQILNIKPVEQQVSESTIIETHDSAVVAQSIPLVLPEQQSTEVPTSIQSTTQVVSEATTECPVPIQVAESVLQAEPKESVSEDPRPIIEAVVSSIIPSVQESASAVSERLIEPGQTASADSAIQPQQLNGHDPLLQLETEKIEIPVAGTGVEMVSQSPNVAPIVAESIQQPQQEIQPVLQESQQTEVKLIPEESSNILKPDEPSLSPESVEKVESSVSQKSKLTVKLPQTTTNEEVVSEVASESTKEISTSAADVSSPDILQVEFQAKPDISKDIKIPGTPIVIAPTPPTSPPLEIETASVPQETTQKQVEPETNVQTQSTIQAESSVEASPTKTMTEEKSKPEQKSQTEPQKTVKKVVKKVVKKSSPESDTPSSPESEGTSKKVKKVVKKVVKKPKEPKEGEEGEASSSADAPKKVVKTVKKTTKTSPTSLEASKTVPETPPPSASSEVPIPPKRKPKSTSSAKTTVKKPDES